MAHFGCPTCGQPVPVPGPIARDCPHCRALLIDARRPVDVERAVRGRLYGTRRTGVHRVNQKELATPSA
jgi:hypothetical protein